jgi:uncharacterized repeat protein (TIGR01451 family)
MGLTVAEMAHASPSTIQVCTQVASNGDINTTEGGSWSYSVANQTVTYQNPATVRDESQSASPPSCAAAAAPPGGSISLNVLQNPTPPANWLRDAPGYPQWTITDGTHQVNGSGSVNLSAGSYSQFVGPTKVTFVNASGRLVNKVCNVLQDNGVAPAGQSGSFTLTVNGTSTALTGTEGAPAACTSGFQANIPIGATSLTAQDLAPFNMASGFPQVQATDANSHTVSTGIAPSGSTANNYAGPVSIVGTQGDVTLTFTGRINTQRSVSVCKTLLDNGDGIDQGGSNSIYVTTGPGVGLTVVEGASAPVCVAGPVVSSSATSTPVREVALPANFQGFAVGFPKWAIYDQGNLTTPLLTGTGTVADIPWTNAALTNTQAVQVVFTDKAGAFGNGTQPATGAITKICKYVEDNADGTTQGGTFLVSGSLLPGASIAAFGYTPAITEGTLSCPETLARWSSSDTGTFSEPLNQPNWPGNAAGYPKLKIYNIAAPAPASTPLSSTQMSFEFNPFSSDFTSSVALPNGDSTAVIVNRAGSTNGSGPQAQTITFCMRVDDNGIAPSNDGGTWAFTSPAAGQVVATEGSGAKCLAPVALPDPNGPWTQTTYAETVFIPTTWPGFDVYANGNPFAASPYVEYASTGGNSGVLDATAGIGSYGSINMVWGAPQSFFQGISGNLTVTFVARPSARFQVCGDVLQNSDGTDDSNSFGLFGQQANFNLGATKTVTEGQAPVCVPVVRLPDQGNLTASETLPSSWNSAQNTSGFPQWTVTSNGPAPVSLNGSGLTTSVIPQAPAASQGDTTITFFNRLGAFRHVSFCKEVADNGDSVNDGGTFQLTTRSNDAGTPSLGTYSLTANEQSGRKCGTPVQLPALATTIGATEAMPSSFTSAVGYPQWYVETSSGAKSVSGVTSDTGNIDLNSVPTSDFTVVFRNQQSVAADVGVTITDNAPTYTLGGPITYTVVVTNAGPINASGLNISDTLPSSISNVVVSCVPTGIGNCGTNASSGNGISYTGASVNAGAGNALTYTISGKVSAATTGKLIDTVTVAAAPGTDPNLSNNTATDTDDAPPIKQADLSITNTDGRSTYRPGIPLVYTIVASNGGPDDVSGATVTDTLPAALTGATWTCTPSPPAVCAAPNGTGSINTTVDLPANSKATFTLTATVAAGTTGALSNTATVSPPTGVSDPNLAFNSATDTDNFGGGTNVDLAVTIDDFNTFARGWSLLDFVIVVQNNGPADALGVTVTYSAPSNFTGVSWTCTPAGAATCSATGNGDINDTADIPLNGSLLYHLSGTVVGVPEMPLVQTVTVSASAPQMDTDLSNNTSTDTDDVGIFANGFDSTRLGAKRLDIQGQGDTIGVVGVTADDIAALDLSEGPQLVAEITDSRSRRAADVHIQKFGSSMEARISLRGDDGIWSVGRWTPFSDMASLLVGWSTSSIEGVKKLDHIELHDESALISSMTIAD